MKMDILLIPIFPSSRGVAWRIGRSEPLWRLSSIQKGPFTLYIFFEVCCSSCYTVCRVILNHMMMARTQESFTRMHIMMVMGDHDDKRHLCDQSTSLGHMYSSMETMNILEHKPISGTCYLQSLFVQCVFLQRAIPRQLVENYHAASI